MDTNVLVILLIAVLVLVGLFVLPRIRMRRAASQVVAIFQSNNAFDARSAKTVDELRLRPPTFLEGMLRMRDFKPYALQALMEAEVVKQTEDGRLYLSQNKLTTTSLYRS